MCNVVKIYKCMIQLDASLDEKEQYDMMNRFIKSVICRTQQTPSNVLCMIEYLHRMKFYMQKRKCKVCALKSKYQQNHNHFICRKSTADEVSKYNTNDKKLMRHPTTDIIKRRREKCTIS